MRAHLIGSGILLGFATAVLAAPSALAAPAALTQDGAEVFITADGSPQAGEDIEVVVRCFGEVGQPESPILDIGELQEVESPAGIPTYVAPATINADTEPGDYSLTATCDGETLSTTITVQPPDSPYPPESPGIHIAADGSPQAGEDIEVVVRCGGEVGQPESPVLDIGELHEVETPAELPTYVAPATIRAGTEPGDHPVTATCDGETLTWTFTVYPADARGEDDPADGTAGGTGDGPGAGAGEDGEPGQPGHQVTRTPRGAPETGAGAPEDQAGVLLGAAGLAGLSGLAGFGVLAARRLRHGLR